MHSKLIGGHTLQMTRLGVPKHIDGVERVLYFLQSGDILPPQFAHRRLLFLPFLLTFRLLFCGLGGFRHEEAFGVDVFLVAQAFHVFCSSYARHGLHGECGVCLRLETPS